MAPMPLPFPSYAFGGGLHGKILICGRTFVIYKNIHLSEIFTFSIGRMFTDEESSFVLFASLFYAVELLLVPQRNNFAQSGKTFYSRTELSSWCKQQNLEMLIFTQKK